MALILESLWLASWFFGPLSLLAWPLSLIVLAKLVVYFRVYARAKPLPVPLPSQPAIKVMGVDILPAVALVNNLLPEATRLKWVIQQAAPPPAPNYLLDWHDHFGEDPYVIEEVDPGRVWRVEYAVENFFVFGKDAESMDSMFGMDYADQANVDKVLATASTEEERTQILNDILDQNQFRQMVKTKGKCAETVRKAQKSLANMIVVKLNSGGLLLYSPVRVRDELSVGRLFETIGGKVEWLVVPSSAHTLQLPAVMKRFPGARLIASRDAGLKLEVAEALPGGKPDFDYTQPDQLAAVNDILKKEGVSLHNIDGDNFTSALVGIAHKKVAMECDLFYSQADKEGVFAVNKKELNEDPEFAGIRLFRRRLICPPNSPNGALAIYRFWMMDPTGLFSSLLSTRPKLDGSSITDMARSLRAVLEQEFELAVGTHINVMPREDFRRAIDVNWRWLDGKPLI